MVSLGDSDYAAYYQNYGINSEDAGVELSFINVKTGGISTETFKGKMIKKVEVISVDSLNINYVLVHVMSGPSGNLKWPHEHQLYFYSLDGKTRKQIFLPEKMISDYVINKGAGRIVLIIRNGFSEYPPKKNEIKVFDLQTLTEIK